MRGEKSKNIFFRVGLTKCVFILFFLFSLIGPSINFDGRSSARERLSGPPSKGANPLPSFLRELPYDSATFEEEMRFDALISVLILTCIYLSLVFITS